MKVRVINTKHSGIMPGDEGTIEGPAFKGFAVHFDVVRGIGQDKKPATVYLTEREFERIDEEAQQLNPS